MAHRQCGTRLALAGLCLAAALSASAGAPVSAAEARKPSSVEADRTEQSAGADEPGLASHGGALYNPFSTAVDTAASTPHAEAAPTRQVADERSPDLMATAVTALVAAGLLVIFVRVLIAS